MEIISSITIILACEFLTSNALVIRRSAQNQLDLSRALRAVHRQKRFIDDSNYLGAAYNNIDDSYVPYNDYLATKRDYVIPQRYSLGDVLDAYPEYFENSYFNEPSEKRNFKRSRAIPSHAELEEIFKSLRRTPEHTQKRQILSRSAYGGLSPEQSKDKKSNAEETNKDALDKNSEKLSESKMEELISEAEKEEDANEAKERENSNNKKELVSVSELKTVFAPDDNSNPDSSPDQEKNEKAEVPSTAAPPVGEKTPDPSPNSESERFWKLSSYMNLADNKKKRVAKRDYDSDIQMSQTILDLTSEVGTLRDEVERLKLVEKLEDTENDFLASALKEATMSQLQGNDRYLRDEYKNIEKAIKVEEMLQSIKTDSMNEEAGEESDNIVEQPQEPEDLEQNTEKRDDSEVDLNQPFEDTMGRWYETPVSVDSTNDLTNDENQKILQSFVQEVLNNQENSDADEDIDELQNYLKDLTPEEKERIEEEIISAANSDKDDDCPNVDYLTTNCDIADSTGLSIDDDARSLCNRHELCYVCGGTIGIDQSTCDTGFRGDVVSMCGQDTDCIKNGARFLWFIKTEHKYNTQYIPQCNAVCVKDYIVDL